MLKSFEYSQFKNEDRFWEIKSFELGKINLFAAKNATGKSRTIKAINWLSTFILDKGFNNFANYVVEFSDNAKREQK